MEKNKAEQVRTNAEIAPQRIISESTANPGSLVEMPQTRREDLE